MKTILLTGGTGFIGSHTSLVLLEKGYKLIIIDSHVNSRQIACKRILEVIKLTKPEYSNNLSLISGDLRDQELLNRIFFDAENTGNRIDAVIHLAGLKAVAESIRDPLGYWDSNLCGALSLLKVMEAYNCMKLIFSSTATIYGSTKDQLIKEDSEIRPINPYGNTKAAVEQLLNDLFQSNPDKWCIANLRYFNPIGAHESGLIGEDPLGIPNNIFPLINRVAARQIDEFKIYGNNWDTPDGTPIRDYIHVMDLSEGHVNSLEYLLENKPQLINLNLGTAKGTSVLELINAFEKVNQVKVPYVFCPRRKGDSAITVADNSRAIETLKWFPKRNLFDMCSDGWRWQKKH